MLWWDDSPAKQWEKNKNTARQALLVEQNGESLENCYRNTGSVPVPRKISKPSQPGRKISAPEVTSPPVVATRKVSCPVLPRSTPRPAKPTPRLLNAPILEERIEEETVCDFTPSEAGTVCAKVKSSIQPASSAGLFGKVANKPKLLSDTEKAKTTEAEVKKELKRGSMRDKWGLSLIFNIDGARITLKVKKVSMFSPAAKAGIGVGDSIITINDWNIEAMENIQAVINIFLAAGFSVNLGWSKSVQPPDENWQSLDLI